MNKRVFNIIGWILLLGMGASWIGYGYSSWYSLLLPLAYICFSVSDGTIKKLKMIKEISILQVILILIALIVSVGVVFGFIQLANYLINDVLHLTGGMKKFSQIIAVIFSLYPVQFIFGSVVHKVTSDLTPKHTK